MFNANCREGRGARKRFVPSLVVNYCSAFALWLLPLPSPQERWKEGLTQINSFNAHGSVVSRFYYTHLGTADLVLESKLADRAKSLHNTMLLPITYWNWTLVTQFSLIHLTFKSPPVQLSFPLHFFFYCPLTPHFPL